MLCLVYVFLALADFSRTVFDYHIIDLRFLAVALRIFLLHVGDEMIVEVLLHEVDGASAEASAHDSRTGNAILACDVVEIVEFFARNFVFLAQSVVGSYIFLPTVS